MDRPGTWDFSGKRCLVTGATSGIGRATASGLATAGARVFCVGRDEAGFREMVERMEAESRADLLEFVRADLAVPADRDRLATRIAEEADGRLDCMIHCAGLIEHSRFVDSDSAGLERMLEVNVKAPYALTKALLPLLTEASGDVVFVNSSVIRFPRAHSGQYSMTKHALLGLAESLRAEVNEMGVRVLSVFPGRTATPMTRRLCAEHDLEYRPEALLQPESVATMILASISLPRTAEVTDIHIRPATKA
jgi:NAD(P)-dependent dehydrogenase (short-subunit alcohol dehydrogenase family)